MNAIRLLALAVSVHIEKTAPARFKPVFIGEAK
jgi:hypothetical protein